MCWIESWWDYLQRSNEGRAMSVSTRAVHINLASGSYICIFNSYLVPHTWCFLVLYLEVFMLSVIFSCDAHFKWELTNHSPATLNYSLQLTHHSLRTIHFPLTHHSLHTIHFPLTRNSLHTIHFPLTHNSLHTIQFPLTHNSLHTIHLPLTHHSLLTHASKTYHPYIVATLSSPFATF